MKFEYPFGATPIDEDEKHALLIKHITTQKELDEFESLNIAGSLAWANRQKNILEVNFLKKLHKHMYGNTWGWAGQFRKTQKNIGVEAYRIETELHQLCGDVSFQIKNKSFESDEIATRFHHRLVYIHAFVNGNGRHARLACDLLLKDLSKNSFSWGSHSSNFSNLTELNDIRKKYIMALRAADRGDYQELLAFVRS